MQVLLLGKSDVDTAWVKCDDVPEEVIKQYENEMQPHTQLLETNLGGQTSVTAVVVSRESEKGKIPKEKRQKQERWTVCAEPTRYFWLIFGLIHICNCTCNI